MNQVQAHLKNLSDNVPLPPKHIEYLLELKRSGVEPKIIYDIGSCVLQWQKVASKIWPKAQIFLFDAFPEVEFLFSESKCSYHIGVLSDEDDKEVKFYQNTQYITGNSYYKEHNDSVFPPNVYKVYKTSTLDSVVKKRGFPKPDLIKIDVQGSERDVLKGAIETLKDTKHLIIEMQHEVYNLGAPLAHETTPYIESLGWELVAPLFCNNGPDGDYHFRRN